MKKVIRIAVVCLAILFVFYIVGNRETTRAPLEAPVKTGTAVPVENKGVGSAIPQTSRPEEGLSTYIGQHIEVLTEAFGEPERIEPSHYHYDWWVYTGDIHLMVGVTHDGIVNQLYTGTAQSNVAPFELGQSIDDIYRFAIVGSEVDVNLGENIYTFSLNSEDLHRRPLIIYQDLFAQLYIDEVDGQLEGVRFIDLETIVLHQPYEMTYMGELLVSQPLSSMLRLEVNGTIERQVFELTNIMREKHELTELEGLRALKQIAQENSEQLAFENIVTEKDEEEETEALTKRLDEVDVEYRKVEENTAFDYDDAIEAVHGWMNSTAHRKVLLTKDFTHLGVGVYGNYFTQIFIKSPIEKPIE